MSSKVNPQEVRAAYDRLDRRDPERAYHILCRVYGGMSAGEVYNHYFLSDVRRNITRDSAERLAEVQKQVEYSDMGFYGPRLRTDIHSPSNIDPADYEFVGSFVHNPPYDHEGEMLIPDDMSPWFSPFGDGRTWTDLLSPETSPDRPRDHLGQCDHCGAWLNYVAVYRHKSGQFIQVGHDCAANTLGWSDRRSLELARQKSAMDAARKSQREEEKRRAGLAVTTELFPNAVELLLGYEGDNEFVRDVASRLTRYGTVKRLDDDAPNYEDQLRVMDAVLRAHERDTRRSEERARAAAVPEGRFVIEGEVVKVDEQENDYGVRWVMTVKHDDGWLVWGTIPSSISPDKGDRVRFTARVERSRKDKSFGFYKRPSRAEIVEEVL